MARYREFDYPNPGLAESCQGCRWKLKEVTVTEGELSACAKVEIFEGVILQTPQLIKNGECWGYGIPSPYCEQLTELVKGKTPEDMSKLPAGLPSGLSQKLLFYAAKTAKFY